MITLVLSIVALVCAAIPAVIFFRNQRAYRPPPVGLWRGPYQPSVSVLIPARNEEHSIRAAVESALASVGVRVEVLVMDDHSEDRTAEIVEQLASGQNSGYRTVRLLHAPSLPTGWNGKQHACARLAEAASHDWLVFMDADVRLEADALARMVAFMEQNDMDLGSGIPRQVTASFWEKLVIPQIHFLLLGFLPIRRARKKAHKAAYGAGCGQLFIAHRDAYERSGGHAAIRASRHDGIKLPRLFRRMGFKTDLFDATDLASCRMYRNGGEVWRGFMKNATEGLGAPKIIIPFTALLLAGQVLPFFLVWKECDSRMFSLMAIALAWYPRFAAAGRFHQPWLGALLHPFGVVTVLAIQWVALGRHILGMDTAWKGRSAEQGTKRLSATWPMARRVLPLLVAALLAAVAWVAADEPAKKIADFTLSDQYDTVHAIAFPREKPCLLTVADNAGSKQIDSWVVPLKKQFGETIDFLGVADVSSVPGPLQGMVKGRFKKKLAYPVMLDWQKTVVADLQRVRGEANIYVVNGNGVILAYQSGEATADKLAAVSDQVSAALKEQTASTEPPRTDRPSPAVVAEK